MDISPMLRFFWVSVIISLIAGTGAAQAQNSEIFTVPKVAVYAIGDTAAKAQAKAQASGRRKAMDLLLRRLTAEEDWVYLPSLALGGAAKALGEPQVIDGLDNQNEIGFETVQTKRAVELAPNDLEQMEEGFSIFEEKTSSTSYRAKITYRFKPAAVRRALQRAGLPYSEAQARRALIIPVFQTDNGIYLWEANNPWARAWLDRPLNNELTPLILPIGDRQDIEAITAMQAKNLGGAGLSVLASRYRVSQVIIANGRLQEVDGEFRLMVRLVDGYLDGRTAANASAEAAARRYDSADGFGEPAVASAPTSAQGRVVAEAFFRGANDDFPLLARRAVETTVARYAKSWKAKTLIDHSSVRPLRLTAWFVGLEEWGAIQRALEDTPLVQDLKVGAMSKENAVIDLRLIGDNNQLGLAMRQSNLTVWQSVDGGWNIANNRRAQSLQLELNDVAFSRMEGERSKTTINTPGLRGVEQPFTADDQLPTVPITFDPDLADVDSRAPVNLDAPVALEQLPLEDIIPAQDDKGQQ